MKIAGILLIPVVAYFIPVTHGDGYHSICLFKNVLGTECYGCGITRAIVSALHFNFETAFQYNKLWIVVLPLLIYVWGKTLLKLLLPLLPAKDQADN